MGDCIGDCINQCEDFLAQIDDQCAIMMNEYPFWAHVMEMDLRMEKRSTLDDEKRSALEEKSDNVLPEHENIFEFKKYDCDSSDNEEEKDKKAKRWLKNMENRISGKVKIPLHYWKDSFVPNFHEDDIIMYQLLLSVRSHILKLKHKIFQMTKPGDVLRTMGEQLKIKADLFHKKIKESDEYNKEIHLDFFEIRTRVWILDARARFLKLV